jgi:hypothetical protein
MKDKPISDELRELLWRRPLSEAEQLRAGDRPETRAELELETRLNAALEQLPAAPVPSNFTARVLQAIDLEEARPTARGWRWALPRWIPRLAVTAAVVAVSAISWQHHEMIQQRRELARSVAVVVESSALPGVEALKNYDVIQRMSQSQRPDDALLALMQ